MGTTYEEIKELNEKRGYVRARRAIHEIYPVEGGSDAFNVGNIIYKPDSVHIPFNSTCDAHTDRGYLESLPQGIRRVIFTNPNKEYMAFTLDGEDEVKYFLVHPQHGLTVYPVPGTTKFTVDITYQDYEITVDRKLTNETYTKGPASGFYQYVQSMWDLMPQPEKITNYYPRYPGYQDVCDKDKWYSSLLALKFTYGPSIKKSTALKYIRTILLQEASAFKMVEVPNTTTSHNKHWSWSQIDKLLKKGRLVK